MSGCDYLPSVKGIGFKKAYSYLTQAGGDLQVALTRMRLKHLQVPSEYESGFDKAFLTFNFQVIYCPKDDKLKHLNDPETSVNSELFKKQDDVSFMGKFLEDDIMQKLVSGKINPFTYEEIKLGDFEKERILNVSKPSTKLKRSKPSPRKSVKKNISQMTKGKGIGKYFEKAEQRQNAGSFFKKNPIKITNKSNVLNTLKK